MTRALRNAVVVLALLAAASAQEAFDPYAQPQRAEVTRNYDVLHYEIHLRFDQAAKTFWGEDTVTLSPQQDSFDKCVLDAEILKVTAVRDANGKPLKFSQDPHSLTVQLPSPHGRSEKVAFTVSYFSRDPLPDPTKYGMPADYHLGMTFWPEATDHPALISTMSFPEGARHWFPSNDIPSDKATSDIYITVDDDQSAVSNGRLIGVKEDPTKHQRTFHWAQEKPHSTYLFVVAAGPYKVLEQATGKVPLHEWVYPNDAANAPRSFAKTPEIVDFFAREFGYPYPWAKYDQITIPGIGGGAESTSATVLSQGTIHDARAEQDFSSTSLVAHEAAHQWWGDLVTFRTWSDTWLNEGFATYSEYLFTLHNSGEDEAAVNLLNKKLSYLREAHGKYMRPIVFDRYQYPNELFDRHSYEKGALVLTMLRFVMGDEAFLRGFKQYLEEYAFRSADTRQLQSVLEKASGQQLGWFFDQWLYRPGHPVLDVSYRWDPDRKKVNLRVEQKQPRTHDTPIFRAPVLIGISTAEGKTSHKVWLEKQVEDIELDAPSKPLFVRFDEGNHLLAEVTFQKDDAELLYALLHDDVIGRMSAAQALADRAGNPDVLTALMLAARSDPFWAVRVSSVEALAKTTVANPADFFRDRALDKNSRVRVAALHALAGHCSRDMLSFFLERFQQDDSYLAQAEALRGVGACGTTEQSELLKSAVAMPSPRHVLKDAAEAALSEISARRTH